MSVRANVLCEQTLVVLSGWGVSGRAGEGVAMEEAASGGAPHFIQLKDILLCSCVQSVLMKSSPKSLVEKSEAASVFPRDLPAITFL